MAARPDQTSSKNCQPFQVGLGTDCSGGFSPSLLNSMRMAVMASNTLTFSDSSYRPLQYSDAVYLATRGGALLTGMQDRLGALRQNMLADFLLVDMTGESGGDRCSVRNNLSQLQPNSRLSCSAVRVVKTL